MDKEQLRKEAEEIKAELDETEQEVKDTKKPLYYILGLVALLVTIMLISTNIQVDPSPSRIPTIEEVFHEENIAHHNHSINNHKQYRYLYKPAETKRIADKISSISCDGEKVCQAKALYSFVKKNLDYIGEKDEYIKGPKETLSTGGGDCDDFSILLANLMGSIGLKTRLVFVPNHVYIEAYLPEAAQKYQNQGWVTIDGTCEPCSFGELPDKYSDKPKVRVDL
ncbi:MAG: transglutaminase-like domain-containing protein [Nanobdellota archaeon]